MKLSEIRTTLQKIRVSPVKTLGQNFLHDQNLARWIIDRANLTPDDYVVEIGPGLGALTKLALEKGVHALAIEKDTRLANFLREHLSHSQLEVINADALDFDPQVLFSHRRVKLLGTLPYNISSQLVLKFLGYPSPISLWLLMLQKEMALRLSASPRTGDYGALTLRVQLYHRVEYLRTVRATVFFPQPDVDSAVVRITPRDPLELPACDDDQVDSAWLFSKKKAVAKIASRVRLRLECRRCQSGFQFQGQSRRVIAESMDWPGKLHRAGSQHPDSCT